MLTYLESAKPVAYVCESRLSLDEVIRFAEKVSKGREFILLLNESTMPERLLPAYLNAAVRHADNIGKAAKISMEMLVYVAGTPNISEAIKKCGATGTRFIVFSTSARTFSKFKNLSKIKVMKRLNMDLEENVAEAMFSAIKE